jgi:hypothetical protein
MHAYATVLAGPPSNATVSAVPLIEPTTNVAGGRGAVFCGFSMQAPAAPDPSAAAGVATAPAANAPSNVTNAITAAR